MQQWRRSLCSESSDVCCYGKDLDNIITVYRGGFYEAQLFPLKFRYLRSLNLCRVPTCFDWILASYCKTQLKALKQRLFVAAADEKGSCGSYAGFSLRWVERFSESCSGKSELVLCNLCIQTTGSTDKHLQHLQVSDGGELRFSGTINGQM